MKRARAAWFSCLIVLCLSHGAFAQRLTLRGAPAPTGAPATLGAAANLNPAPLGGILASGLQPAPGASPLLAPALTPAAGFHTPLALPLAVGVPARGPAARGVAAAAPLLEVGAAAVARPGSMLMSAQELAGAAAKPNAPANAASDAGAAAFDGNTRHAADVGGVSGGGNGSGGSGGSDDGSNGSQDNGGLGRLYPRVVMILDTLDAPAQAEDKLVQRIEALLERGVRVVFVTARPEKGENSADSMLVSQLKVRTRNPLVVVSYNGARIAARSSKAENPKGLVEDLPGFAPAAVAKFREISARVSERLGVKGGVAEFGEPSLEDPYIYGARLPENVDPSAWTRAYNGALKAAGFRYKVETAKDSEGRSYFYTQSTALRLNTTRLFNGLYALAPELNPATGEAGALKPGEVLVLADPTKAPSFLRSLPGKGYFLHGVTDKGGLAHALSAVLGQAAFEKVTVNRYDLREYTEWLERREKGGSGFSRAWKGNPANREMGFFRGILIKEMMARLYHLMRKGQYHQASLDSALEMLQAMWYHPAKQGIRVPPEVELAMNSRAWKALSKGYLDTSKRWLKNYYHRNFRDYPRGVSEHVVGRMIRLSRDGDSITVPHVSPYTGRVYNIYVRPDRTELREDTKGYILVGHVYRTGREPLETQFEDSVDKSLVARAMLEGDAQKRADGRWYVNDEPDPRVQVVFHYNTREISEMMTTAEVDATAAEITALIEKRETDQEYQKWRSEQDAKREKAYKLAERASKQRAARAKAARADRPASLKAPSKAGTSGLRPARKGK